MDDASKNLQKSNNLFKLNKSPFRHMGGNGSTGGMSHKRSPFRNIK